MVELHRKSTQGKGSPVLGLEKFRVGGPSLASVSQSGRGMNLPETEEFICHDDLQGSKHKRCHVGTQTAKWFSPLLLSGGLGQCLPLTGNPPGLLNQPLGGTGWRLLHQEELVLQLDLADSLRASVRQD